MSIFYIKIGLSVIHRHHDVQNNRLYRIMVIIITKKLRRTKIDSSEFFFCTPLGIRTLDPLIKSQLLYQLS